MEQLYGALQQRQPGLLLSVPGLIVA